MSEVSHSEASTAMPIETQEIIMSANGGVYTEEAMFQSST